MQIKKKYILFVIVFVLIIIFFRIALSQNLAIRNYIIYSEKITNSIRAVLLTDLHSTIYGENQEDLIKVIDKQKPDIIFLAGDIADDKVPHNGTEQLLKVIGEKYPCYYVAGNHEHWSGEINKIKDMISSYGVTILEGDSKKIYIKKQPLSICGVDDPDGFLSDSDKIDKNIKSWEEQLESCGKSISNKEYTILLSHRPEKVIDYNKYKFDLILCGHAHGGQVRIPYLLNGLYAPNQGIFPKYSGGEYKLKNSVMIVSRGLVKNNLPRIFNPPELIIIDLKPKE